ncbi:CAF17-like 4Fe-4S cluster assembly/insertion protein YgfZ [Ideonella livida]|uniref:Folate-binding protein YgfZ n=1 Tax=Ideonella livida TaxID=2707176 RepID=A0A7C9TJD1_9BURK|nr:folate-binding protein YgfZ [Ideonella livida]NDY90525.1 folate-binding protein YgfZ [Ideonella livida]
MFKTPSFPEVRPGVARLADWGLIRAEGEDAATFLQGQLTQDVQSLREGEARLAGYCSAKGRLLATFVVWRPAPDVFLLACSADLLPTTLKRLSMFVLRAKCRLSDASGHWTVWGQVGAPEGLSPALPGAAWQWGTQDDVTLVRLPDVAGQARALRIAPAGSVAPDAPALEEDLWRWLEVASGVARVNQSTVEAFVPQMINLELVGGVSFKKGCYPGQEVVARSQYRGTLKRRAYLLQSEAPMGAGQEVFHAADPGQPAGTVVLAASWPGLGALALVELKRAAAEDDGDLRAGQADGPALVRQALPYALPAEEA